MHTAYDRKDNSEPASITSLAVSKDHRTLYVGEFGVGMESLREINCLLAKVMHVAEFSRGALLNNLGEEWQTIG